MCSSRRNFTGFLASAGVPCQATASSVEERSMKQSGSSETSTDSPSLSKKSSVFYNCPIGS